MENNKKKLYEMMGKINKLKLNEVFNLTEEMEKLLNSGIEALRNKDLLSERGGKVEVTSQKIDDGLMVDIEGTDKQRNEYYFKFHIIQEEDLMDNVLNIVNINLIEYSYSDSQEETQISLSEDDLRNFNKENDINFYDIIVNYIDVDLETEIQHEIKESHDMDEPKYLQIVFIQGEEANEPLDMIEEKGEEETLEYLKQWQTGDEDQVTTKEDRGLYDRTYEKDDYVMFWNPHIGYIGLDYKLY